MGILDLGGMTDWVMAWMYRIDGMGLDYGELGRLMAFCNSC